MLRPVTRLALPLLVLLLACTRAPSPPGPLAVDAAATPSSRVVALNGARLEVLDWGGAGEALVFVAGLGASGHAFEGFASRFTDRFHIFGVTRRGHGASEATEAGYDTSTLAEDLRALLDDVHVARATFVAHSFGGEEITCLAVQHPDRVAGVVYLDAAYDQARGAAALAATNPPPPPGPSAVDTASPVAYRAYMARMYGMDQPLAEIEATNVFDGAGVHGRTLGRVIGAMRHDVVHCDYSAVHAPALALYAVADSPGDLAPFLRTDPDAAKRTQPFFTALTAYREGEKARFLAGVQGSRAVDVHGAQHWIWTTHPTEVEREMRAFFGNR